MYSELDPIVEACEPESMFSYQSGIEKDATPTLLSNTGNRTRIKESIEENTQ